MKAISLAGFALVAVAATANAQQTKKPASDDLPANQRPPKGMCRIWLKDVPAARQPAATDCASAVKNCPPNGRVIFGDADDPKGKAKAEPAAAPDPTKSTPMVKTLTGKRPAKKPPFLP